MNISRRGKRKSDLPQHDILERQESGMVRAQTPAQTAKHQGNQSFQKTQVIKMMKRAE